MSYWSVISSLFLGSFLAATIVPFSSEVMFIVALKQLVVPATILVFTAAIGNTLGGLTGYWLGTLGKWEWLEKYFRISKAKVNSSKQLTERYGYWLALLCWLPFVGDVLCVILGFFKLRFWPVAILMFTGKIARYVVIAYLWN